MGTRRKVRMGRAAVNEARDEEGYSLATSTFENLHSLTVMPKAKSLTETRNKFLVLKVGARRLAVL